MQAFLIVSLALYGALFGSFANVVIWRFPRGESLSRPPSHCPTCEHPIRWRDNVPVLSWLLLRGRCRDCGEPIAWRYPVVEALSALLWASAGLRFGITPLTASAVFFFYMLMLLAFIDIDTMRLPNPLVALTAAWGLLAAVVSQYTTMRLGPLLGGSAPLAIAIAGALLGAVPALAVALAYRAIRGRSGFGMGDIKLLGAMGLFLGPYVLIALFLGSLMGSVGGLLQLRAAAAGESRRSAPLGDEGDDAVQQDAEEPGPVAASDGAAHAEPPLVPERPDPPVGDLEDQPAEDEDALPMVRRKFAFGPYLALAGVFTALFGPALWEAYVHLALGLR